MKKSPLLIPKQTKKTTSIRLPDDLRSQAENVAKKNGVTFTAVVEAGLKLLIEKVMNDKAQ